MNQLKIACTGHRTERLRGKEEVVKEWIKDVVGHFATYCYEDVMLLCGGAEGTDEIFGQMVFDKTIPPVRLALYLPCRDYRAKELAYFNEELSSKVWAYESWRRGADNRRDRMMVDDCDVLLAVWDGLEVGGTWKTIEYARKKNKIIMYIPKEIFYEGEINK